MIAKSENPALEDAVKEIITKNWNLHTRLTPLSYLGTELKKRSDVVIPVDFKLLQFVKRLEGIDAIQRPGHPLVWGLYPSDKQLEGDIARYFVAPDSENAGPLFKPFLWQAFKSEIPYGTTRVIDFNSSSVDDHDSPVKLENGQFKLVQSDQLAPADRFDRQKMIAHIESWLSKNAIDQSLSLQAVTGAAIERDQIAETSGKNLLDAILDKLTDRDLQKLNFPLDIVEKLRKIQL